MLNSPEANALIDELIIAAQLDADAESEAEQIKATLALKAARANLLAAMEGGEPDLGTLPCDVQLPGVKLSRGVSVATLMLALERRRDYDDITPEAVDVMRKRAASIMGAQEWELVKPAPVAEAGEPEDNYDGDALKSISRSTVASDIQRMREAASPSGWRPHDGKSMPYGSEELVDVRFRNGQIKCGHPARHWHWTHNTAVSDLIAHRPHNPDRPAEGGGE